MSEKELLKLKNKIQLDISQTITLLSIYLYAVCVSTMC